MTKIYMNRVLLLALILSVNFMAGQDLVHYWNFNNNASVSTLSTPSFSLVPGAAIAVISGGTSAVDPAGGTGQDFDNDNHNARNGDPSGTHLRFNNPIGGGLEFAVPTTGFANPVIKFSTRRSGSGAGSQLWSYSLDGSTYTVFVVISPADGNPELKTLDFSAIAGADNNPNFKVRVLFAQGAGGTAGNNRFDNFTLDADLVGGDTFPPIASITPENGEINVSANVTPTISFNEDVRLLDNSALTNLNVDAVVELRIGNASGAMLPFDATYSGNTITINPGVALETNQEYYVSVLPNMIEDMSDNALSTTTSAIFTTIAVQTPLTAGDIAFVGYRMNANGVEDEIAFVTLKSLADGTVINFTDSKFTNNAQPMCAGGIVWTADAENCIPAGTVISIQTSTLISSNGFVTGTGFGLSSNGDQVIAYTGNTAAPNFITAMTSNGWIAATTDCGGSESMRPAGLVDGTTSLNATTTPGNVAGNTANAFYNGSQTGTAEQLRTLIMNPANWTGAASGTAPQVWPTWNFPTAVQVTSATAVNTNTIQITFSGPVNEASATNVSNYSGISGLTNATLAGNVVTLNYGTAFEDQMYVLNVSDIIGANGLVMACDYNFEFDASLETPEHNLTDGFKMYPNPSKGWVQFNQLTDIQVFDFTGKTIYTQADASGLDTSSFATGMYLLKTSSGFTAKLVVK